MARREPGDAVTDAAILHVDLDAFYASVEQLDDPSLRGRPVIVGGLGARGVVSAASYEAREFGVHSAMPMGRGAPRVPHGGVRVAPLRPVLREEPRGHGHPRVSDPARGAVVDRRSVPRCARGAPPPRNGCRDRPAPAHARSCRGRPRRVGRGCDHEVPGQALERPRQTGWAVARRAGYRAGLSRSVTRLPPLGRRSGDPPKARTDGVEHDRRSRRDAGVGAHCEPRELARYSVARASRNQDPRAVVPEREAKSIGAEETYAVDLRGVTACDRELVRLVDRVSTRLRHAGLEARTITLKIRYENFETRTRARTVPAATDVSTVFLATARELLEALDSLDALDSRGVRLLGVSLSQLEPASASQGVLALDDVESLDDARLERRAAVEDAVDAVRDRFGSSAVGPASLVTTPTNGTS